MGAGLISYGEAVRLHQYRSRTHTDYCMMLAGGIVSLISWTCVLVLYQFYHARSPQGVRESYTREKQQEVNTDQPVYTCIANFCKGMVLNIATQDAVSFFNCSS